MNYVEELKSNQESFLKYMAEKYPVFYDSNMFLRDVQYAAIAYFKLKGKNLNLNVAEEIAREFMQYLESKDEVKYLENNTWRFLVRLEEPETAEEEKEEVSQTETQQ
ncbi:MAG: hypothetical protein GXO87_01210 [Chlorobi bacterium]|nr:hypothetical protein [Chlorobiota bacterium]